MEQWSALAQVNLVGRLVDIGRKRQLDVLIHISLTLAIKLQPNSAAGGHHQRWDIGVAAFGRT